MIIFDNKIKLTEDLCQINKPLDYIFESYKHPVQPSIIYLFYLHDQKQTRPLENETAETKPQSQSKPQSATLQR